MDGRWGRGEVELTLVSVPSGSHGAGNSGNGGPEHCVLCWELGGGLWVMYESVVAENGKETKAGGNGS